MIVLRTLLFVPGNQERRIEKARSVVADALILDLEDSVPLLEKNTARQMVTSSVSSFSNTNHLIFVRVNSLSTPFAEQDIKAVVKDGFHGILLPKSETVDDIRQAETLIAEAERENGLATGSFGLLALVETPRGLINVNDIAGASERLSGITFGAEDYALEMSITRTKTGEELYFPRMTISLACHAAGIPAIDSVFTDIRDRDSLIHETRLVKQMGFQGKLLIHPDQVDCVNEVFTPSEEEIAYARSVVTAFEMALTEGKASVSLDGKMVDAPVAERARKLLSLAEHIYLKNTH